MRHSLVAVAVGAALLVPVAPATAFHHVRIPANVCGQSEFAGGNNPTAAAALRAAGHELPIAPVGTPGNGVGLAHVQCPGAELMP